MLPVGNNVPVLSSVLLYSAWLNDMSLLLPKLPKLTKLTNQPKNVGQTKQQQPATSVLCLCVWKGGGTHTGGFSLAFLHRTFAVRLFGAVTCFQLHYLNVEERGRRG